MSTQHHSIITERLVLRPWKEADLETFAELNGDPRVMEYFPKTLTRLESAQLANRIADGISERGWGFWAATLSDTGAFIGFIGLSPVNFDADFTPAVEVGWRLAYDSWGKGYASEGARAALNYGFEKLGLNEIVAFTAVDNMRSRRVMEKIGMFHDKKGDFDHPKIPEGNPLRRHVLYRIKAGHFTQVWEAPPENFLPHVEVSACYLEVGGRILFLERNDKSPEGGTWGVPAGKIEKGESPLQAAMRELVEETGIQVSFSQTEEIGKLYVKKPTGAYIYHMFQIHLKERPLLKLSSEHTGFIWASAQDLAELPLIGGAREALQFYERMKK